MLLNQALPQLPSPPSALWGKVGDTSLATQKVPQGLSQPSLFLDAHSSRKNDGLGSHLGLFLLLGLMCWMTLVSGLDTAFF